jgi:HPt (histidine-containing phosphotransfer) domain-containing protein
MKTMNSMSYSAIDPMVLWRASAADLPTFRLLAGIFLEQAPPLVGKLRAALQAGHAAEVASASHALKGMTGLIGAGALGGLLQAIEQHARGRAAEAQPDSRPLPQLFDAVMQEMAHAATHFAPPVPA